MNSEFRVHQHEFRDKFIHMNSDIWFHDILHDHEFICEFILWIHTRFHDHEFICDISWPMNSYMNSCIWRISWNHTWNHVQHHFESLCESVTRSIWVTVPVLVCGTELPVHCRWTIVGAWVTATVILALVVTAVVVNSWRHSLAGHWQLKFIQQIGDVWSINVMIDNTFLWPRLLLGHCCCTCCFYLWW